MFLGDPWYDAHLEPQQNEQSTVMFIIFFQKSRKIV